MSSPDLARVAPIEPQILIVRGQKVLLDRDLAELYRVRAIALRQQVRRNPKRFPPDFLFQLTSEEVGVLVSQNVIASRRSLGGAKPLAFTEQGIAMLSSVLTSQRAIEVNIAIMRAFVKLRQFLATHEELAQRLDALERQQLDHSLRLDGHAKEIDQVFAAIGQLIAPPKDLERRRIGFAVNSLLPEGTSSSNL